MNDYIPFASKTMGLAHSTGELLAWIDAIYISFVVSFSS